MPSQSEPATGQPVLPGFEFPAGSGRGAGDQELTSSTSAVNGSARTGLFDGLASMTDFTELRWITTTEGTGCFPI
jgi:hypothetical protein